MRILCLHGLYQNAETFTAKTQRMAERLAGKAKLQFVTAPHQVTPKVLSRKNSRALRPSQATMNYRAWWTPDRSKESASTDVQGELRESLRFLRDHLRDNPVDGILGFSQGASMASLMCTAEGIAATGLEPKFAILAAGRQHARMQHWYDEVRNDIPTLHMCGTGDRVNTATACCALADKFAGSELLTYKRGHSFPDDNDEAGDTIEAFLHRVSA
eukprot:TRINITY_DN9659_c0_g1_i1.p1 TRINITY_DN9659_c0_g1~~TRINITY_DN9659_c0_g1_i1.p1  ORF type:complete len:215 (-),score=29.31 TRINITY_DN9659_c0_g1_i1:56-700(-)